MYTYEPCSATIIHTHIHTYIHTNAAVRAKALGNEYPQLCLAVLRGYVTLVLRSAMAVVKGLSESQGARMFHLMMIIPAGVLLLLLSLVSLGTMANANKQVKEEIDDLNWDGRCILYTKSEDLVDATYNDGGECEFAVWGGAVLAIVAVILSIVLGAKAFFGIPV